MKKTPNIYSIYMHKNKINNKIYIGQTKQKLEHRWGHDGNGYKSQMFFFAIQKYGWENFEHIVLYENLTKEQANLLEDKLIKKYKTQNPKYGYNIKDGGNASSSPSGKEHFNSKQVICLETMQQFNTISEASKWAGLCEQNKGDIHKVCVERRLTAGKHPETGEPLHWCYVKDYSEELKNRFLKKKNHGPNAKKILCVTTGEIFNSMEEAQKWSGLKSKSGICLVCQGKRKYAGKYPNTNEPLVWKYYEEEP